MGGYATPIAPAAHDAGARMTYDMSVFGISGEREDGKASSLFTDAVLAPAQRVGGMRSLALPDDLAGMYAAHAAAAAASAPPSDPINMALPDYFVRVLPLDEDRGRRRTTGSLGYLSSVLKATSSRDGLTYAVRRVDGLTAHKPSLVAILQAWGALKSPHVVPLRDAFVARVSDMPGAGGGAGQALFFVHDYLPGAVSIAERVVGAGQPGAPSTPALPESVLWMWACQLALGLKAVHAAGLALRCINAAHVLIGEFQRVRFACAGVMDVLEVESPSTRAEQQAADVAALGRLLLSMSVRWDVQAAPAASQEEASAVAMAAAQKTYSAAWVQMLQAALEPSCTAAALVVQLAPAMAASLDTAFAQADGLHAALAASQSSARLFRTAVKLGQITERPEHAGDPAWSDTGPRYALKLFRDFVFHQVDESGRPVLDAAHVVESLTRLDLGDRTPVLLSSRDGENLLVASYETLRRNMNEAYNSLASTAAGPSVDAMAAAAGQEARAARVRERAAMHSLSTAHAQGMPPFAQPTRQVPFGQRPAVPGVIQMPQSFQRPPTVPAQIPIQPGPAAGAAPRFNTGAPAFQG